jgi:phenylalanyl-tRNA synthetase alpha chain
MSLLDAILKIEADAGRACADARDASELEALRVKYLGRKGELAQALANLRDLDAAERPRTGQEANRVKAALEGLFRDREASLGAGGAARRAGARDLTMPSSAPRPGSLHPITQVTDEICDIFARLGFRVATGPEMETEHHNFGALNIPADHPSRDSFDTFYLSNGKLLRSQTSTVQIRVMEKTQPPVRIVAPGRVYRPDATDASHSFMFHQIEGLWVDEGISFADLKGALHAFARAFFGKTVRMRLRPHFFPFTEPSAEVDISCALCKGSGCRVCKDGWIEILGAGSVHPRVLEGVKISPERYTGFAFGMGVERIAMLRWSVPDIRMFYENDVRFLRPLA